jgi:hypothetical protein
MRSDPSCERCRIVVPPLFRVHHIASLADGDERSRSCLRAHAGGRTRAGWLRHRRNHRYRPQRLAAPSRARRKERGVFAPGHSTGSPCLSGFYYMAYGGTRTSKSASAVAVRNLKTRHLALRFKIARVFSASDCARLVNAAAPGM